MSAVCGATADFARGGFEVALDCVLGPWFLPTLIHRCPPAEISVDYVVLLPTLDTVLNNLAHRSGHGFQSVKAATKMYGEFESAIGEYRRHVIDSTGKLPADTLAEVEAQRATGRLRLAAE